MQTLKDRLDAFLKHTSLSQAKFAEEVGVSVGFANNVGASISTKSLNKIKAAYPSLSADWLLTGEGSMLKNEPKGNATYNAYIEKMMNQVNRVAVESLTDSDLMDMLDNAGKDESELEIGVKRVNKGGMRGSICGFNRKKTHE